MNRFPAHELGGWSGGVWSPKQPTSPILGFSNDSRSLKPGDCFVALSTDKRDGHDFVAAAAERGAVAAIVSRAVPAAPIAQLIVNDPLEAFQLIANAHRERFLKPVVGITGSAGKTSTKDLLRRMLGGEGVCATAANLNNQIGVPLTLLSIDRDAHACAVVEAGTNHLGEIPRLSWLIDPTVSIVTLVAPAHLEFLGSIEAVAKEKAALIENTRASGMAFIPSQCLQFEAFRRPFPCAVTVVRAQDDANRTQIPGSQTCLYRARHLENETQLELVAPSGARSLFTFAPASAGMVSNVALALCAARRLGRADGDLQSALSQWKPSPMRGEIYRHGDSLYYLDCYNANPASLTDALEAFQLRAEPALSRLYVIGSMGELGPQAAELHRRAVAQVRLRPQDRVVAIGQHAADIAEGLVAAGNAAALIETAAELDGARALISGFAGAFFFKGSRSVGLERLLPAELLAQISH